MGLSSAKKKTTSTSTPYAPATAAIDNGITQAQGVLSANQGALQQNSQLAQNAFTQLANNGAFGNSPYVANAQNNATAISNGAFLGTNPGADTYKNIQASVNPSLGSLTGLANGTGTNPASATLSQIANGQGAGSSTLNAIAGGSYNNPSDAYSQSVTGGKYLNAQPSSSLYSSIMDPSYLTSNPYLDKQVETTNADVSKAVNQRFASAGQGLGVSSALGDVLSKNLANSENTLRYTNYNDAANRQVTAAGQSDAAYANERSNMQGSNALLSGNYNTGQANALSAANSLASNALGASTNLGSQYLQGQQNQTAAATALGNQFSQTQQNQLAAGQAGDSAQNAQIQQILASLGLTSGLAGAQYAGVDPALATLNAASTTPYTGLSAYSGILNSLAGQYGTKTGTETSTPSLFDQAKSGVQTAAGLASIFSDRRLKTEIARVGQTDDGLGVYTYRYKAGGPVHMGVMADEVATLRPEALGPVIDGYSTVNYSKLGAL